MTAGPGPHRGFRDAELLAVANRVYDVVLSTATNDTGHVRPYDVLSAVELEVFLYAVRAALNEVRATPQPPAARPFPAAWWLTSAGAGETLWRPGAPGTRGVIMAMQRTTDPFLWAVIRATVPDRGECIVCTADPCPTHAPDDPR